MLRQFRRAGGSTRVMFSLISAAALLSAGTAAASTPPTTPGSPAVPPSSAPAAPPIAPVAPESTAPAEPAAPASTLPVAALVTTMSGTAAEAGYTCVRSIADATGDVTVCTTPDLTGRLVVESQGESVNRILLVTHTDAAAAQDQNATLAATVAPLLGPDEAAAVTTAFAAAPDGPIAEFPAGGFTGSGDVSVTGAVRRSELELQRTGTTPRPPAGLAVTKEAFDAAMTAVGLTCSPEPTSSTCADAAGTPIAAAGFYGADATDGTAGQLYVSWFSQSNPDVALLDAWWAVFSPQLPIADDVHAGDFATAYGWFIVQRRTTGVTTPTLTIAPAATTTPYL